MTILLHNWHLKIAALALSLTLYGGLVLAGALQEQTFAGVPVGGINPPRGGIISDEFGSVDVTYRNAGEPATASAFVASVDLSSYDMDRAGEEQSLPVDVRVTDPAVTVVSVAPESVSVVVDVVSTRSVPVFIETVVPDDVEFEDPVLSEEAVQARGPQSALDQVDRAVATVTIDRSGINVDRQVQLAAVDARGERVQGIQLVPDVVGVAIRVTPSATTRLVPVHPTVSGEPATGHFVTEISVQPLAVTIAGPDALLREVSSAATDTIDLTGLTGSESFDVELLLPDGVRLADDPATPVRVSVGIEEALGGRTLLLAVECSGVPQGLECLPQASQVSLALSGPLSTLAGLSASSLVATLDTSGSSAGEVDVTPQFSLPSGVEIVSVSPSTVTVLLTPGPSPEEASGDGNSTSP